MKSNGFTLIELAVVLAVITILAAVLTPLVTGYIDQARETRAQADVRAIGTAVLAYQRDTSRFPIYTNIANANSDTAAGNTLIGTGNDPTDGAGWTLASLTTLGLDDYLNTNKLSLPTTARGGRVAYRGPYLNIADDPWGNSYLITAQALTRTGSTDHGYVISAGPNATMETTREQVKTGAFTVGGDDIVQRIR